MPHKSDQLSAIPLHKVRVTDAERDNVQNVLDRGATGGAGDFTKACDAWLTARTGARALLTNSGTAALELACLVAGLKPGDEVIMPSFTFPSTANAVALRGATPVFVDIRPDTLNIDETLIEAAATKKTRAIMPVHYAGVACAMDEIMEIARRRGLVVIEDAAHAICSTYKGRALGAIGDFGAISFHSTKNISCGQGGAFLARDEAGFRLAEMMSEKGTNRAAFLRGETDKYSWQCLGANYRPSEVAVGMLAAQLERADEITEKRRAVWDRYHDALAPLEAQGLLRRPVTPEGCDHNAHIYYVLFPTAATCDVALATFQEEHIGATFHYVPLHLSPAGRELGRADGEFSVTCDVAARMLRLPIYQDMDPKKQERVIETLSRIATGARKRAGARRRAAS